MWRRVWPRSLSSMFEIRPLLKCLVTLLSWVLVSLNAGQRYTLSGRKPEREGSSGQSRRLEISIALRRRTSA